MANYKSSYTGAEIDAGIAKANTALQEHQDISGKVDKVEGKGLSTNDYTTAEKEKLAGIDMSTKQDTLVSGTNIKTINNTSILGSGNIEVGSGGTSTDVQINGTSITSQGEANIVTEGIYNASTNKIATMNDLPDVSTKQDKIDSSHKLSADLIQDGSTNKVVTSTEKTTWSGKQDALVSGTNIKTINNTSLLGSGNIDIQGGGSSLPIAFSSTEPAKDGSVILWVNADSEEPVVYGVTGYNLIGDCEDIVVTDQTDLNPRQYQITANGVNTPYNMVGIKKGSSYINKIQIEPRNIGDLFNVGYNPNATGTQLASLCVYNISSQKLGFRLPKDGSMTGQIAINPTITGSFASTSTVYIIEAKVVSGDFVVTFTNTTTDVVDMTFTWAELGEIYTPALGFGKNTSGSISRTFKTVD